MPEQDTAPDQPLLPPGRQDSPPPCPAPPPAARMSEGAAPDNEPDALPADDAAEEAAPAGPVISRPRAGRGPRHGQPSRGLWGTFIPLSIFLVVLLLVAYAAPGLLLRWRL